MVPSASSGLRSGWGVGRGLLDSGITSASAVYRRSGMRRSILLGVVLAGVLAGCSLGGGSGAAGTAATGWTAYPPSRLAVAAVVERMANGNAQAKCRVIGLEAT